MEKKALQALIDRVIGKNGIMRSPSWWVRRLLNEMMGYIEAVAKAEAVAAKTEVDATISSTSTNPVQNKTVYAELAKKVSAVSGKTLSTNDYTTADKNKLAGIEAGAQKHIQTDWNAWDSTGILNKPNLATVATSGSYKDLLDKPEIPQAQIIDAAMDGSSENPVQNKVVKEYVDIVGALVQSSQRYMSITRLGETCTVTFPFDCEYSTDKTTWNGLSANTPLTFNLPVYYFRAYNSPTQQKPIGTISVAGKFSLGGDARSLLRKDGFANLGLNDFDFHNLFSGCSDLVSIDNDFLSGHFKNYNYGNNDGTPYTGMFKRCSSLTNIVLPPLNSELRVGSMYQYCTSLKSLRIENAPPIKRYFNATFYGCTGLISVELPPLKDVPEYYYQSAFESCSNLRKVTIINETYVADSSFNSWLYGVASAGTFIKNKDASLGAATGSIIPKGWTIQEI